MSPCFVGDDSVPVVRSNVASMLTLLIITLSSLRFIDLPGSMFNTTFANWMGELHGNVRVFLVQPACVIGV